MQLTIREPVQADLPELLEMIYELAEFHGQRSRVTVTEEDLMRSLGNGGLSAYVVEAPEGSERRLHGVALWFIAFSTWEGGDVMHLEDLYVRPDSRGTGAGKALLNELKKVAADRECLRIQWIVQKTNESGAAFYRSQGAESMPEWELYQLPI